MPIQIFETNMKSTFSNVCEHVEHGFLKITQTLPSLAVCFQVECCLCFLATTPSTNKEFCLIAAWQLIYFGEESVICLQELLLFLVFFLFLLFFRFPIFVFSLFLCCLQSVILLCFLFKVLVLFSAPFLSPSSCVSSKSFLINSFLMSVCLLQIFGIYFSSFPMSHLHFFDLIS